MQDVQMFLFVTAHWPTPLRSRKWDPGLRGTVGLSVLLSTVEGKEKRKREERENRGHLQMILAGSRDPVFLAIQRRRKGQREAILSFLPLRSWICGGKEGGEEEKGRSSVFRAPGHDDTNAFLRPPFSFSLLHGWAAKATLSKERGFPIYARDRGEKRGAKLPPNVL